MRPPSAAAALPALMGPGRRECPCSCAAHRSSHATAPLLAIPWRYLVVCLCTRVVVRYTGKARRSEMRPNDGSPPGRQMAQERLSAVRRMLAVAPLPVKILLVAALLLLGVFAAPFLIVAAFIYAPIA